jgi:phosphoserine phosphatase
MVTNRVEIIGVILDLWNTLIYDLPSIEAKRREDRITRLHSAISMAGHVVTRKNLSFAYDSVASIIQSRARKHKGMSIREQINIINEVLRIKVDSMTLAKEVSATTKQILFTRVLRCQEPKN